MLSWELETCLWADLQGFFQEGSTEREGPPPEWVPLSRQHCSRQLAIAPYGQMHLSCCLLLPLLLPSFTDVRTHLLQLPTWTEDHGSARPPLPDCDCRGTNLRWILSLYSVQRATVWVLTPDCVSQLNKSSFTLHIHMVNSIPREYRLIQISRYFPERNEKWKMLQI